MDGYTVAWLLWIVQFFAIEGPAVLNKKAGDTFSEHVWQWFSIIGKSSGWRVRRLSLLSFLVWLVTHFLTGGWV